MKGVEVFLVLALTGVCVLAKFEHGMKVKFDMGLDKESGKTFFYHIPLDKSAAVENDWQLTERPEGHYPTLLLYCKEDRHLCLFYDKDTGFIAGTQICINTNEFTDAVYDWTIQGFTKWTVHTKKGEPIEYQCAAQYYNSKDYFNKPVEERMASITSNQILREKKIWLQGFNGKLDEWSTDISELEKSKWTKQACVPWMGQHYYYNMSADTLCEEHSLYQWFPLTDSEFSGSLVGIGFIAFGQLPMKEGRTDWFERPAELAVKVIVPRGPQCLYKLAKKPGLITMHTYFVNNPWSIGCKLFG